MPAELLSSVSPVELNLALPELGRSGRLEDMERLLAQLLSSGRATDHTLASAFVGYGAAKRLDLALRAWERWSRGGADVGPVACSALLKSCAQLRDVELALQVRWKLLSCTILHRRSWTPRPFDGPLGGAKSQHASPLQQKASAAHASCFPARLLRRCLTPCCAARHGSTSTLTTASSTCVPWWGAWTTPWPCTTSCAWRRTPPATRTHPPTCECRAAACRPVCRRIVVVSCVCVCGGGAGGLGRVLLQRAAAFSVRHVLDAVCDAEQPVRKAIDRQANPQPAWR